MVVADGCGVQGGVYRISFSRPLFKCLSDSCIVNPGLRSSI